MQHGTPLHSSITIFQVFLHYYQCQSITYLVSLLWWGWVIIIIGVVFVLKWKSFETFMYHFTLQDHTQVTKYHVTEEKSKKWFI